jgi:hypothetical protein
MKADLRKGAIAIVLLMSLASCDSNQYNKQIMGGPSDTLYTPSKNVAPVMDTLMPQAMDTTGEQTGRMSDTKMTH